MKAQEIAVKLAIESQALIVRPGDTLLVRIADHLDRAGVDELRDVLGEQLPGVKVLVICADQLAAYRPGGVCGAECPGIGVRDPRRHVCQLPMGHDGQHEGEQGANVSPMRWLP